ncbi:MAG: hypothetical protein JWM85_3067 [Acidimicrobiaceae bacterium]|nr:hypothetical protein [Acidimicrobiaceae bacterium]
MNAQDQRSPEGVVTKASPRSVGDTVGRLTRLVESRGLTVFAVIDQSGEAAKVGLEMPDTVLVLFGNPRAGTPVMLAAPLSGLDLPLKLLVWTDSSGAAFVSYNSTDYLASRYHLTDELAARLRPIEALSDDLVAEGD